VKIESQWQFDCAPHHVWPYFFHATMDSTRPLMFWLGVPKPMSCRVLEGAPAVGNTRQCTTDRGTINQNILTLEPHRTLRYQMTESTVWCAHWVGKLVDTFELSPLPNERTNVRRITEFEAGGWLRPIKLFGLWLGLRQAHSYAARNWCRLALSARENQIAVKHGA
jgi:hypothetical protein